MNLLQIFDLDLDQFNPKPFEAIRGAFLYLDFTY